jgi:pilus assembly protein Flp/PilA
MTDDQGVTLIEYGLIALLIGVAVAATVGNIGTNLNSVFVDVSTKV